MTVRSLSASGLDSGFGMVGCGWTVKRKLGKGGNALPAIPYYSVRRIGNTIRQGLWSGGLPEAKAGAVAHREPARSTFVLQGVHRHPYHDFLSR